MPITLRKEWHAWDSSVTSIGIFLPLISSWTEHPIPSWVNYQANHPSSGVKEWWSHSWTAGRVWHLLTAPEFWEGSQMVWRVWTELATVNPALPLRTGICNAPPQPLDHGIWLPVVTPGNRGPVVLPGVNPFLSWYGLQSLGNKQIPVVLFDINPVWGLVLPLNRQCPLAPKHRTLQVLIWPVLPQDLE